MSQPGGQEGLLGDVQWCWLFTDCEERICLLVGTLIRVIILRCLEVRCLDWAAILGVEVPHVVQLSWGRHDRWQRIEHDVRDVQVLRTEPSLIVVLHLAMPQLIAVDGLNSYHGSQGRRAITGDDFSTGSGFLSRPCVVHQPVVHRVVRRRVLDPGQVHHRDLNSPCFFCLRSSCAQRRLEPVADDSAGERVARSAVPVF